MGPTWGSGGYKLLKGEAHEFCLEGLEEISPIGLDLKPNGCHTATVLGGKIYVIGGSDDESPSISVQILNISTGKWETHKVLGTKPPMCKAHSAILLNEEKILILRRDSAPNDCAWFLEVDTLYVKELKKKLETVVVAWSKGVTGVGPKPVVISGPSGVGKGTLINKLMNEYPSSFGFSVSHTTRAPREKEKDGVHYYFTERTAMEKDIQDGKFLEFANVHGNLYGTSLEAVEVVTDLGKRCILDIDVQGARSVKASSLEVISIFICPPSFDELENRLRTRGTETEEQILKRLRNAITEIEQGKTSGLFDHILVNANLETCYANLKRILDLNECGDAVCKPAKSIELPVSYLVSEVNQKLLIQCGSNELGETSHKLFVLDVSSLKGGAPGRTRGLNIYPVDPLTEGLTGLKQVKDPVGLIGNQTAVCHN